MSSERTIQKNKTKSHKAWYKKWELYLMLLPGVILLILFNYVPMYGVIIAFQDFVPAKGVFHSSFVGVKHFTRFFESGNFWSYFQNTLRLSLLALIINTPLPIIVALLINEIKIKWIKRAVQTISYAPYFISTVVVCSMCFSFLFNGVDRAGIINKIIMAFGGNPSSFMEDPNAFPWVFVLSGVWQGTGWAAIIYIGTLSNISPDLHEAAQIDGASRIQRIIHINIPHLLPIATIMFILAMGNILSVGFEKVFLLQTDLNLSASEIISTYTYRVVFMSKYQDWSYSTAVGLFNTFVNLIFLLGANFISKKAGGESLW